MQNYGGKLVTVLSNGKEFTFLCQSRELPFPYKAEEVVKVEEMSQEEAKRVGKGMGY